MQNLTSSPLFCAVCNTVYLNKWTTKVLNNHKYTYSRYILCNLILLLHYICPMKIIYFLFFLQRIYGKST